MNVDSNTAHPPMQNGEPHDVPTTADDEDQWPDSRIADYEYGALENTAQHDAAMRAAAPAERGFNHHQQATMAAQPTDQQRRPSDYSLSHGPNTGAGVRWAPEPAQVYESPSQFDRKNSSNSSSGGSSTRARADSSHHSEHGISIYSDLPNGPSSVYSTASVSKAPVSGTPLTSLQGIDVQIKDSRVKIDERGKEVNVYMVDVIWHKEISGMSLQEILVESQQAEVVLWTVEKRYSDFLYLNSQLRHVIHRERLLDKLERLPDKDIFRPNAPTKSDKRKLWFERYLQKALSLTIADKRPLLEFLSTDRAMEPEKNMPILLGHKEGFLVKKGKNFGGWKRRYYVCKSNKPVLEYSELPGGAIIGTINLSGAVVKTGKSRGEESPSSRARGSGSKEADMFRHAFLIEERARREGKSPIAHPLWADSDRERDEWVMALRYVIVRDSDGPDRAMREVTKLVKHAKSKEAKPLMIHQIHTSINHEQGARRSIEQARRKEEQRNPRAAGDPRAPAGSGGKFGSPLSNQMWPITGSLDNVARLNPNDPSGPIEMEADTDPMMEQLYNSSRNADRPRSVSLPPAQDGEQVSPMPNSSARPSPAAIAATLSTSFGGPSDALSDQAENGSVHNPPSVISTIESSIYSSYHEQGSSVRRNEMSSRSIDDRNSYASVPDSPLSQTRPGTTANASGSDAGATDSPLTGTHTPVPGASHLPGARAGPGSEPTMQKQNSSASGMKVPFTRNSVGRIVHEEEAAPDLPEVTPHVTDDILGVGRNDVGGSKRGGSNGGSSGARTRTREDKKRGRITFMWGKRKPTDSDHPMPDVSGLSGSKGAAGDSTSVAPRRLRRGSTSNDGRTVLTKNPPFRGPVFEQPLERAVEMTKVRDNYHLPAVVYRCIEFLDAKKAWLEEGIYRQSGSTSALLLLRKEFDANRDYNLLKLSKPPDVHVVASLLKGYLRALPENILTARLCQEFYRVVDLNERHDRVCELGRLVSELPLANYTLLRALSAHLIRIVQRASVNRMTLRNIGIVFSPSLGIPVGVFSLLMTEFEYVFWVNDSGVPEPRPLASGEAAPDAMPLSGQPQMSASVPAGMNRAPADDGQHRVGRSGPDSASFSSESAAYGAPTGNDGLEPHPIAPWYGQVEADMAQDLSRYPGMPPTQPTQPSGRQQGRSNRNSIQYKVGAPRELISQEIGISIPATIDEHDIDDDSDDLISASGDPMMQLNRYASNGMLRTHDNHPPHN
ncbi:Rho GTPase activating protein [Coemansia sp. RSA 2704]|nr:Rho GTPase activating protein [Coemansia sp. RSA 2704]